MDKPAKPVFTMSSNGSHDPLFDLFVTNNPQPAVAGCLPNCLQVANFLDQATCTSSSITLNLRVSLTCKLLILTVAKYLYQINASLIMWLLMV